MAEKCYQYQVNTPSITSAVPRRPAYGGTERELIVIHSRKSKTERRRRHRAGVAPAEGEREPYPAPTASSTNHPHPTQSIFPQLQAPSEPQEPHVSPTFTVPLSPLGVGSEAPPAAYAIPEDFNKHNLAKRPRDWRADYDPRGGFVLSVVRFFPRLRKKGIHEYVDPLKRTIHPLLQYSKSRPPIYHDLRFAPFPFTTSLPSLHLPADFPNLEFPNISRKPNTLDLMQLSSIPSASMLRLYHPKLPWYIDIPASHPNGVTVYDVLQQLFEQLNKKIDARHYYNDVLGPREREEVSRAFSVRCAGREEELREGVRYVDFLGVYVVLRGIVRGKGGIWEVQTSEIQ